MSQSQILPHHGYNHLELALEATSLFWLPFYWAMEQSSALSPFHPRLVLFNPKLVANFLLSLACFHPLTGIHFISTGQPVSR